MGIFTRTRDIISANLNSALDKAEDPEKLIRHLVGEIEDTMVSLKASCARALAAKKRIRREIDECTHRIELWHDRAERAVNRDRDNLAREALAEKRFWIDRAEALQNELEQHDELVEKYQDDIRQLNDKLTTVRDRQRILLERHTRAVHHKRAQKTIRKIDTSHTLARMDQLRARVDRIDAESGLKSRYAKTAVESRFVELERDEEIEKELERLKTASGRPAYAPAS